MGTWLLSALPCVWTWELVTPIITKGLHCSPPQLLHGVGQGHSKGTWPLLDLLIETVECHSCMGTVWSWFSWTMFHWKWERERERKQSHITQLTHAQLPAPIVVTRHWHFFRLHTGIWFGFKVCNRLKVICQFIFEIDEQSLVSLETQPWAYVAQNVHPHVFSWADTGGLSPKRLNMLLYSEEARTAENCHI